MRLPRKLLHGLPQRDLIRCLEQDPVKRLIQSVIINELSKEIIAGTIDKSKPVLADLKEGNLVLKN